MPNDSASTFWLSLIVFLPVLGAIFLSFIPKDKEDLLRYITLGITGATMLIAIGAFLVPGWVKFDVAAETMQSTFNVAWIPSFNIEYFMGIDGISLPLVMLTAVVSFLAMAASWSITKYVKAYCVLFLLLETGMIGVFLALDFFLFYVFWEVMLLPMYFLIGVWGGPRREYAAIKFFLYTLVGSVLMLIAILLIYFNSDLRQLAEVSTLFRDNSEAAVNWDTLKIGTRFDEQLGRAFTDADEEARLELIRTGGDPAQSLTIEFEAAGDQPVALYDDATHTVTVMLAGQLNSAAEVADAIRANPLVAQVVTAYPTSDEGSGSVTPEHGLTIGPVDRPVHTFNLLALAAMAQHTNTFSRTLQVWAFILLFIGFAIKVPSVPVHTWLPDAHVEAPTPISMILAGVLLKMGGYGIIRICYPICPHGGYDLAYVVCLIGVVSMIYGAFAALAQKDFKRLVAYSSVSHMGYVVLGLGVWSATAGTSYNPDYWNMGVQGAMFQMIGHGISSAGMFFMVGVIYDRVHHRNLNEFGGLFGKMPVYTALSIGIFFAGLGLPGLCGFIGEVFVVLSVWKFNTVLAILSASVVVLTAAYILWAIQRVYLGAEYRGPHEEALTPSTMRENSIAGVLFVLAILFGVFPDTMCLQYMDKTIDRQVTDLTEWTRTVKEPELAREARLTSTPVDPQANSPIVRNSASGPEPADVDSTGTLGADATGEGTEAVSSVGESDVNHRIASE